MSTFFKSVMCASLLSLSGCGSYAGNYWSATDNYAKPIGQSQVTDNQTIYSDTLQCFASHMQQSGQQPDVMAVGRILDYTGKDDFETGRRLTQGAALMVISALAKAGIPQVERFDTTINEFELKMKDNKLIKNSIEGDSRPYQPIMAGSIVGSKYTIAGGITELNYNIRSNDVNAFFDIASGGMRYYVMNVAMDFRLIDTDTLQIVSTASYQKQIIGRELQAGMFEFFDNKLLDVGIGERSLEPMQLAVRAVSELAVYDLLSDVYGSPGPQCPDPDGRKKKETVKTVVKRMEPTPVLPAAPAAITQRPVYSNPLTAAIPNTMPPVMQNSGYSQPLPSAPAAPTPVLPVMQYPAFSNPQPPATPLPSWIGAQGT